MYRFIDYLNAHREYYVTRKTAPASTKDVRRDYHPHYEVYFCPLDSEQRTVINGEPLTINQSAVIISAPFSVHGMSKYSESESFLRYTVYVTEEFLEKCAEMLPDGMFHSRASCVYLLDEGTKEKIHRLFSAMVEAEAYPKEFYSYFSATMNTLERSVPTDMRHRGEKEECYYITEVLEYIYENKHRSVSADEIVDAFHVSRAKLDRDFKDFVGDTLHSAITKFRAGYAVKLLNETNMRVRDVAKACGFENEYYFFAFFKRTLGKTPLSIRKEAKAQR